MHPMPLECRDLSTFLPAYVDGEFAGTETAEIEDHLTGCAECRREVSVQEGLKAAVRRAAPALAPIELREAVREKLRDAAVEIQAVRGLGYKLVVPEDQRAGDAAGAHRESAGAAG